MSKDIKCPKCNKKVMTYDDKGTMVMKCRCKSCGKIVSYYPLTQEIKIGQTPERDNSSGKRFY